VQSCENELKKKVLESTMNIPDRKRGGPLFFKIIMNVITSNTEEAIRTLTSKLSTFKDHFYTKRKHQQRSQPVMKCIQTLGDF